MPARILQHSLHTAPGSPFNKDSPVLSPLPPANRYGHLRTAGDVPNVREGIDDELLHRVILIVSAHVIQLQRALDLHGNLVDV